MTVWGHWTLCGLCPGSTHLLYEICSLFVCWETLFALEYSVWGWAVSDGHVYTSLKNLETHSLQAPSCRLSMEAESLCLLGSLHPSECKMGYKCTPSKPDLLIISTVRCCYWCYGSPAVEQSFTWGLVIWICLGTSLEPHVCQDIYSHWSINEWIFDMSKEYNAGLCLQAHSHWGR